MLIINTIYWGDCLEVMQKIDDNSVDTIFCDLPFGTTSCKGDAVIPFKPLWEQYRRIIKPNGAIILFGREPFTSQLINSNLKGYKHKWVWNKKQSGSYHLAKYQPLQIEEDIIVFTANGERVNYYPIMRKGKMRSKGGNKVEHTVMHEMGSSPIKRNNEYYPTNILEYTRVKYKIHPFEKPLPLLEYLVKTYTKEGEIILDNSCGSASLAEACLNTNRKFLAIEKDENYYNLAINRISGYIHIS